MVIYYVLKLCESWLESPTGWSRSSKGNQNVAPYWNESSASPLHDEQCTTARLACKAIGNHGSCVVSLAAGKMIIPNPLILLLHTTYSIFVALRITSCSNYAYSTISPVNCQQVKHSLLVNRLIEEQHRNMKWFLNFYAQCYFTKNK